MDWFYETFFDFYLLESSISPSNEIGLRLLLSTWRDAYPAVEMFSINC